MLLPLALALTALLAFTQAGGRQPRRWVELVVIICNDDWASKGSNIAECVRAGFDLLFIQEGKAADYRSLVPIREYGVHQDRSTPARAGAVIVWRHQAYTSTALGYTFGVKARGILGRWVAWSRGHLHGTHVHLWIASAHWPPKRTRAWQPLYSAAVWARVRLALAAGRLILIGTDSNQDGGPPHLPASLTWASAVRGSIDGLIHSRTIEVVSAVELPKDTSDHHPQRFILRVPV